MHITRLAPLATIAGVALLAAGCGSSPRSSTTSTTAASSPQDKGELAFRYAACMRSHGVSGFPDPIVSTSPGGGKIAMHVTPAITGSPKFATAQQACRSILPSPSPAQTAQQQHQRAQDMLSFAKCMRSHGVNNFPDPTSTGELNMQMLSAAGVDIHTSFVQKAAITCVPASNGALTPAQVQQAVHGGGSQGEAQGGG